LPLVVCFVGDDHTEGRSSWRSSWRRAARGRVRRCLFGVACSAAARATRTDRFLIGTDLIATFHAGKRKER
jgi:hypothetical protein